jgi:hypothetical protein
LAFKVPIVDQIDSWKHHQLPVVDELGKVQASPQKETGFHWKTTVDHIPSRDAAREESDAAELKAVRGLLSSLADLARRKRQLILPHGVQHELHRGRHTLQASN